MRRDATVDSQAAGLSGRPCAGHCTRRRDERLLHRVLGGVEVPVPAHQRAEDLRRELAQQVLGRRGRRSLVVRGLVHQRSHLDLTDRANGTRAAISSARAQAVDVDDVEAAEVLLGLEVGTVGDDRCAVDQRHLLGQHLVADAVGAHELAGGA